MIGYHPSSFRDPQARVLDLPGDRVYRLLSETAWHHWKVLSQKEFFQTALRTDRLVVTEEIRCESVPGFLPDETDWKGALSHQRIPFVSYPFEWSFRMLQDAALMHIELLQAAMADGFTMKDGTAYNLQWNRTQPVFIDIPTFVPEGAARAWTGYRQFCQQFLFPLMLQSYKNLPFQPWLRGRIEGLKAEEMSHVLTWRDWFRPGVAGHVFLHALLEKKSSHLNGPGLTGQAPAIAKKQLNANIRELHKVVQGLSTGSGKTVWSNYVERHNYSPADYCAKKTFVGQAVTTRRWNLVWDLGCNTGEFSRIAAAQSNLTVAIDADAEVIDQLYVSLKAEPLSTRPPILPLVINLADQAAGLGWRGEERMAWSQRGSPDLILGLALVHHLCLSSSIPLPDVLDWLAQFRSHVILEFITEQDPMAQLLIQQRVDSLPDYNQQIFEASLLKHFEILEQQALECGTRFLYFAKHRSLAE